MESGTGHRLARTAFGVAAAIGITTAMDAKGLSAFSALPLCPLFGLFWFLDRLPRASVGLTWGRAADYGLALLHPLVVLSAAALVSVAAGAADLSNSAWEKAGLNFALVSVSTILVAILTEEGFFRGWLWGSLERAGLPAPRIWILTSLAFALWHVSAVVLPTGFDPPAAQVPVYLVNAAVMGAAWGLLRWITGSVIVASVAHGVWNGGAYVFFGYGTKVGALGIRDTALYGPEVGFLGLGMNLAFVVCLWSWWKAREDSLHVVEAPMS
jgi:membrane protease YdiL (CAAX protease family)